MVNFIKKLISIAKQWLNLGIVESAVHFMVAKDRQLSLESMKVYENTSFTQEGLAKAMQFFGIVMSAAIPYYSKITYGLTMGTDQAIHIDVEITLTCGKLKKWWLSGLARDWFTHLLNLYFKPAGRNIITDIKIS